MDSATSYYSKVNCRAHCFLSSAQLRLLKKRAWNTKRRGAIANLSGVVWGHLVEPHTHKPFCIGARIEHYLLLGQKHPPETYELHATISLCGIVSAISIRQYGACESEFQVRRLTSSNRQLVVSFKVACPHGETKPPTRALSEWLR